jgi:hypothetical protein
MDKEEVLRRLRVYYELPAERRRPLSWAKLAQACGEEPSSLYQITLRQRSLTDRVAKKIAYILMLMEQGRIAYISDPNARYRKGRFIIADEGVPAPKVLRRTIVIGPGTGPRFATDVVNPMQFPPDPPLFRKVA